MEAAIAALKAAQQRVRETVSAFGDCRAAARAESGDYAAANSTSFEDAVEAAMLKIAVNASIIEDIHRRVCSRGWAHLPLMSFTHVLIDRTCDLVRGRRHQGLGEYCLP